MLKNVMVFALMSVFFCNVVFAADGDIVKIIAVSKTSWSIETKEIKEEGTSGVGMGLGTAAAWLVGAGPLVMIAGGVGGDHVEKNISGKNGTEKTTSETVHGYRIKLNTGKSLKTLVKYKVGQKIRRDQIAVER